MAFYHVTGEKLEQAKEFFKNSDKQRRKATKWAKSYGGTRYLVGTFQEFWVVAIEADECPGLDWKNSHPKNNRFHNPKYWTPKLGTKNGKKIIEEMHANRFPVIEDLQVILECEPEWPSRIGVLWRKGLLIIETPKGMKYATPKGIERISDVKKEELWGR